MGLTAITTYMPPGCNDNHIMIFLFYFDFSQQSEWYVYTHASVNNQI